MYPGSYKISLTLKFSLVSHGSDYDNVHIPSVTMLTVYKKQQMHYIVCVKQLLSAEHSVQRIREWNTR